MKSIIIFMLCVGLMCSACDKFGTRVDEKMIDSAIELAGQGYEKRASFGFGAMHPVKVLIDKMEVIDIGEKNDNLLPVKFHIEGRILTKEDRTDASSFPIRLDTVDVVKPINDTVVYYFSNDEFNKPIVCDNSQADCIRIKK